MTVIDRLREGIERHPDWPDKRIASAIRGATQAMVRSVRDGTPLPETPTKPKMEVSVEEKKPSSTGVISLDAVRKRFDIVAAIECELSKLPAGKLVSERELALRAAGKDASRFRRALDNNADRFKANRIRLKLDQEASEAQWYWGSVVDIRESLRLRDE